MKIVLAGPTLTSSLRQSLALELPNAPPATAATPIAPLAAALRAMGHDIHIITTDPTVEETVTVQENGVTVTYCPLRGAPRYRAKDRSFDLFEKEIQHIATAMRNAEPDIVHAHWTYEFAEAAVRTKLPHLVTMHDLGWQVFGIMKDAYRFVRLLMKYRTMCRVKHLTTVAPFMIDRVKEYGYFRKAIAIPNGLTLPENVVGTDTVKYRSTPVFATIGDAGNLKNVRASLRAFERIRAVLPDAVLHLFGPGLDENFVDGAPSVIGHGNVDHRRLMSFLQDDATLLIHPSRMEACPVIIAEAKARGVPVVAGERSGGVPYVCGDDAGCLLVDIENPSAIANAALDILKSAEHYGEFSRKARRDVELRFDSDHIAAMYVVAYEAVLGENW